MLLWAEGRIAKTILSVRPAAVSARTAVCTQFSYQNTANCFCSGREFDRRIVNRGEQAAVETGIQLFDSSSSRAHIRCGPENFINILCSFLLNMVLIYFIPVPSYHVHNKPPNFCRPNTKVRNGTTTIDHII